MRFQPSLSKGRRFAFDLPLVWSNPSQKPTRHRLSPASCFDSFESPVVPVEQTARRLGMSDNDALYAIRHPDGSVSLYIDEEYAAERGVDPATLTRVEIPRELFTSGTVQQVREYVAVYLEAQKTGTA